MFIQTEETGAPATLKFLPGRQVLPSGTREFARPEDADDSPLAGRLFEIGPVRTVVLETDRIAVTKDEGIEWKTIKPAILGAIMDHFTETAALPPASAAADSADTADLATTGEAVDQILDLLETRIAPVARDQGGEASFVGFHEVSGRVHMRLSGSAATLLGGIQTMLRHYVPEVREVVNHDQWVPKPGLDTDEGLAVQEILDNEINPGVASHGGNVKLIDVADHTVYLEFGGGCHGCGMVDVTLKQGVETRIMEAVPTITAVLDITDHAEGTNPYYQPGA
ncbi:MAG: NifU family protein [Proteobacteria bacterium]|nr:NifU family protein [Pseudomonadota bacterium]